MNRKFNPLIFAASAILAFLVFALPVGIFIFNWTWSLSLTITFGIPIYIFATLGLHFLFDKGR